MKKLTLLFTIIAITSHAFTQSVIIKDNSDEVLISVNDEGINQSSITITESTSAISSTKDKLHNEGGTLKWSGSALSTGGNTLDQAYDQGGAGTGRTITADAGAFNVGGVDGTLFTGTFGTGTIPETGEGTRMMWYPKKAAFRAGYVGGSQWDDSNVGNYSTAIGGFTIASGGVSTAMGGGTTASGDYSTALCGFTTASGDYSTAMGFYTTASGNYSTAMGYPTKAESYASVAIGRYNIGGGNSLSWVSTDPLFEIGMGADADNKSNAMTVLKNGNVGIGITTPIEKLEVNGNVKTSGNVTVGDFLNLEVTTQTMTPGGTISPTSSYIKATNPLSSSCNLSKTTSISDGATVGQILILEGNSTPYITRVYDNANVQLTQVEVQLKPNCYLTLMWNGTDWIQLSLAETE